VVLNRSGVWPVPLWRKENGSPAFKGVVEDGQTARLRTAVDTITSELGTVRLTHHVSQTTERGTVGQNVDTFG
jgi:hypothetical protein